MLVGGQMKGEGAGILLTLQRSLFYPQTCPHSKDPVWSQMFSFFVYNVAAEELHLKVCLELGSWGKAKKYLTQEGRGA